jgi:hypothetical protein
LCFMYSSNHSCSGYFAVHRREGWDAAEDDVSVSHFLFQSVKLSLSI